MFTFSVPCSRRRGSSSALGRVFWLALRARANPNIPATRRNCSMTAGGHSCSVVLEMNAKAARTSLLPAVNAIGTTAAERSPCRRTAARSIGSGISSSRANHVASPWRIMAAMDGMEAISAGSGMNRGVCRVPTWDATTLRASPLGRHRMA